MVNEHRQKDEQMDRRSVGDGDRELAGEWLPVRTLQAASMLLGRRRCAVAAQSPIYDQAAGDKHPRMPILAQAHAGAARLRRKGRRTIRRRAVIVGRPLVVSGADGAHMLTTAAA